MRYSLLFIISLFVLIVGCESDNMEDLFPDSDCSTANISFSADVKPVIQVQCNHCHGALIELGGVVLENYADVKGWVDNGRFLGAIKHLPGFSPMPQVGTMLDDCTIAKIESWIEDGAPDN